MRIIHGLFYFYLKLIIPSLLLSTFLSLWMLGFAELSTGMGISFLFLLPVFQYLVYELRNPGEYYFYYNLGLSRSWLWRITLAIGMLVCLVLTTL
jgi:hypothetical protein